MSVTYVFSQYNLVFTNADQPLTLSSDLILMANASGVSDDSRMTATCEWFWEIDGNYGSGDTSKSYIIRMTGTDPVLTVAGDYSALTPKDYNLSITSTNNRFETAAVRANSNMQLLLTSQAGAYMADGNVDANITVNSLNTIVRSGETYKDNKAASNKATALGFDVAGTLTLLSDLIGNINVNLDAKLQGIRVQSGDDYTATNTSTNQDADAIGIRSAKLVLNRNFNAIVKADDTATLTGYGSLTVTDNTVAAKGLRVLGDLSATDGAWSCSVSNYRITENGDWRSSGGEWNGTITATLHDSKLGAAKTYVDTVKVTEYGTATVSNNDFSVYGIWADGDVTIDHLKGKAGTEISATASDNIVDVKAESSETASITLSGNTFYAYGIKGNNVTLKRVDSTFDIAAKMDNVAVSGSLTASKNRNLTLSGNKIYAVGIDAADTLTLGSFNGRVTTTVTDTGITVANYKLDDLKDDTLYRAYGINAKNIYAADNFGGVITVTTTDFTGVSDSLPSEATLEVAGIYAATAFCVTGRINSTVNVTMKGSDHYSSNPQGYGIRASGLFADAFSGSINMNAPLDTDNVVKSVGLLAGAISTTTPVVFPNATVAADAFDINGTITSTIAGVITSNALNLRVSGNITGKGFDGYGFKYLVQDGIAIETDGRNATSKNNDQIELASTAVVKGDINMYGGENSLVLNSGAQFTGKLLADGGEMNIRFDLDKTIRSNAIVTVDVYEDRNGTYTHPLSGETKYFYDSRDISLISTSHITVNLNNAVDGETYKLFQYKSFKDEANNAWLSGAKGIAFSYQGQSLTRTVTGGTASATFTDGDGNQVTATLTYSNYTVTVTVTNNCTLAAFTGALTTTVDADSKQVKLGWEKQTFEVPGIYEVEYRINGAKTIAVKTSDFSTTINGFDASSTIQWRVRRNTANGTVVSDWSAWTNGASGAAPTPAAPDMTAANPTAVDPGGSTTMTGARARLYWNDAVAGGEIIRYEVEGIAASTKLDSTRLAEIYADPSIATTDPDITFFTKTTTAPEILASQLPNRTFVYWRVRAVDAYGQYSDYVDGNMFRVFLGDDNPPAWDSDTEMSATAVVIYNTTDRDNPTGEVTLTWPKAEDLLGSGIRRYRIDYRLSGASAWQSVYADESDYLESDSAVRSGTITGLASGSYEYRIYAQDYVGNVSLMFIPGGVAVGDVTDPEWNNAEATTADGIVVAYDVTTDPDKPVTDATFSFGAATDVDEAIVYKRDSSGNFVYEKDEFGNVRVDADGNPIKIPIYTNHASGVKEYVIEYWTGSGAHKSITVAETGAASYTCTLADIARSKSYSYTITAFDFYGNATASLAESSITLGDFTAPMWQDDSVSAFVSYDVTGTYPKTDATINFGWAEDVDTSDGHITNPGSGVKEYVVKYWTSDYEYDVQTETVTSTGATAYTWNRTLDGGSRIFKYEIYARDFYGNEKLGASGTRIGDFTAPEWQDDTITVSASYDLSDPDAPKMNLNFAWGWAEDVSHTDETGFVDPGSGVKEYVLRYRTSTDASVPLETVTIANDGSTSYATSVTLNNGERIYSYGVYARDYYGNETGIVAESVDLGDFTPPVWRDDSVTVGIVYDLVTDPNAPEMTATFNWGWAEDVTADPVTNPASGVKKYVLKYWTSENDADMHDITVANTGATSYSQAVTLNNGERIYKYEITAVDYYENTSVALTGSDIGDFTAPEWVDDAVAITVDYDVTLPNSPKTGVTFEWGYAEDVAPEVPGVTNYATGVKEYVLKYWFGTDDIWSVTLANDGSTSYTYTIGNIIPNRNYSYSIAAVDYYGNETAITGRNVTFGDFTAPQNQEVDFNAKVFYDAVSDPASPSVSVTFNWSGTEDTDTSADNITNPGSGVKEYVLSFDGYEDVVLTNTGADAYTYTFGNVAKGDYGYSVYAVDFYGNRAKLAGSTAGTKIHVDKDFVAPEWQDDTVTVDLSYDVTDADDPKLNAAFNWGYAIDSVSASDVIQSSGVKEYVLKYWTTTADVQTVTVANTGAESYTYVIENIAPNTRYSYSITAVDFFDNKATISGSGLIIADVTRPAWQDDTFVLAVDYNTTDPDAPFANVTFNWGYAEDPDTSDAVVSNPGSGVKEYVLKYWTSTADVQTVTVANDGSTSYSYTAVDIDPSQSYSYSVAAVDYYGNEIKLSGSAVLGDFTGPVWQDSDVDIEVLYDTATDPDAPTVNAVFNWGYAEDADTSTATVTNLGSGVKEYVLKYWTSTEDVQTVTIAATVGQTSYSYMAEGIVPGDNYSYSIAAVDYYGNSTLLSGSGITIGDYAAPEWQDENVSIAVAYDVTDPEAPKTGATFAWGYAEDVDTSVPGIENLGSGVKEYVLKIWTDETERTVTVANTGAHSYTYTLDDIVPGDNYSYSIVASDFYGNSTEIGASGVVLGDFTAPAWQDEEVLIDIAYDVTDPEAPKTGATFYWGYAADVDTSTDAVTNPGSGVKEYVLKIWTDETERSVTVTATGVETYSYTLDDIDPDDNYSYSIAAVDFYGNSTEIVASGIVLGDYTAPEWQDETVDIAVAYDVTDPEAPKTDATFTWGFAEDVDGSSEGITNPGSGVKEYVLSIWTSTADVQTVTVANTGATSYTYTLENIAPSQNYSYSIAAVDYYGNSTEIGASGVALGDFTAPEWQDDEVSFVVSYDETGASPKTSAVITWGYAEDVDASVPGITNPGSGVKEYVLKYWTSASDVKTVTVASTGATSYSYTLADILPSDNYSYSIAAVDYFGNEATISGSGIALGDFTAPEWKDTEVTVTSSYNVAGASPRTDATFKWGYAEDVDASVPGITNPGSGVKEYVLKYWTSASDVHTVTVTNTGATSYSYTVTNIAPSENYSYSITAVDYCDNEAENSGSGITIGDFVSPEWQSDQVTVKETIDRYNAFNVKLNADFFWTAATDDGGSGVKNYVLQYKLSSEDWSSPAVKSVTVSGTTASVTGVAYTLYDYRIQAFDYYGNATTSYLEGTFGSTDDVTPPTGSFDLTSFAASVVGEWTDITTFVPDPYAWNGDQSSGTFKTVTELTGLTVTVSWQDSFVDDSGIVYTVEFANSADFLGRKYSFTKERDTTVATQSLTLDNSLGNSVAVLAGMEKVYYRVSVADGRGNVNPLTSAVQSFEMKDSNTGESVVFDSEVASPIGLHATSTKTAAGKSRLTFRWSDGGSLFGVNSYTLHVTVGGKTSTYTGITDTEYTLADQSDGTYSWSVVANSGSGVNASTDGSSFVVDATSPVFADGAKSSASSSYRDFALTWDAATDKNGIEGYVVRYGSGSDTSKWVNATTTTNSYTGSITADGTYNYRITAVDKYGNYSARSLSGSFTVSSSSSHDSAAKAIPIKATKVGEEPSIYKGTVGLSGSAEWLKFTVTSGNTDVYISLSNVGSSYKSGKGITVKGYSASDLKKAMFTTSVTSGDSVLQIRCATAGTYYLAVTSKKKKAIMDYSASVATDTPTAAVLKQGDNNWNSYDSAAGKYISAAGYHGEFRISMPAGSASGNVSGTLVSDYVGAADPSDFRRLDVTTAGGFKFKLSGVASPLNLTVYSVKYNYVGDIIGVKALKTVKLKPKYDKTSAQWVASVSTKDLMLVSGSYYIGVTAPNANKNKNSLYTVSVTGTLFTKGNNADDNWNDLGDDYSKTIAAGAATTSLTLFANEWVGFGDSVDFRKLTVNQAGSYDFTVSGVNTPITMTVYAKNSDGGLSKVKSVSVKSGTGRISGLLTDTGTYYVGVTGKNTDSGKNTNYKVQVTGTGFTKTNNEDDSWDNLTAEYTISGTTSFSDWVGFGDSIDYRKIDAAAVGGMYTFRLSGMSNKVKLTVYSVEDGSLKLVKSVTGSSGNSSVMLKDLCFAAGTKYYLAVEAPNAKKGQNSGYKLAMTEEGTFEHRNNNSWSEATLATGSEFEFDGMLTRSSGGDDVDFINLKKGDFDTLTMDMKSGKAKLSFYDQDHNAVKAATVTFKDGSAKVNVASVTLVADNPTTDSIRLGDLDDAIKYLRIDAASTGADSYLLKLA